MNRYALHPVIGVAPACVGLLLLAAVTNSYAQDPTAQQEIDVVWSKSDGIRPEIFFTNYSAGTWSEPEMVTDDYYDNMHPVVDRDSSGVRWLFWTAYDSQRTEIRYTSGTSGDWQEDRALAFEMQSNSAPSVVIDQDDTVWVVWAANDGNLDDIYYAFGKGGKFSEPSPLHEPNDVPDLMPVVELNDDSLPTVSWKQMQDGRYVTVTSGYDGADWSIPAVVQEETGQADEGGAEEMIEVPEFVTDSGLVFIRSY